MLNLSLLLNKLGKRYHGQLERSQQAGLQKKGCPPPNSLGTPSAQRSRKELQSWPQASLASCALDIFSFLNLVASFTDLFI